MSRLPVKRFTETTKWRDVWHRRLTTVQKCLWSYLCDTCDHAGIFEFDEEICSFDIAAKVKMSDLEALGDRVSHIYDKKWIITKFIQFQYGKLSPDCKPHKPVYAALEKHNLVADDYEQNASHRCTVEGYLRDKIIARDGGRCAYTGKALLPSEIAIDHVQPRSKGGSNKPNNLVCMDATLNALKADLSLEEFCIVANLDLQIVRERLSNTLSKALNSLQDKEKDKESEKVKDGESAERGSKAKGTLEDVVTFALELGLPKSDGESCFHKWEGNGWTNGGERIKDWRATMRSWKSAKYLPSQKTPQTPAQRPTSHIRSCL